MSEPAFAASQPSVFSPPVLTLDQLDKFIHQPSRLKIMTALRAQTDPIEFTRLKVQLGATGGNLGAHLVVLEDAGYVETTKEFAGRKPRTRVGLTPQGQRAFEVYIAALREIVGTA